MHEYAVNGRYWLVTESGESAGKYVSMTLSLTEAVHSARLFFLFISVIYVTFWFWPSIWIVYTSSDFELL